MAYIKPASSILSRSLKRPSIIIDYRQLDQLEHPTGCFSTCKADTHQVGSMVLDLIGGQTGREEAGGDLFSRDLLMGRVMAGDVMCSSKRSKSMFNVACSNLDSRT